MLATMIGTVILAQFLPPGGFSHARPAAVQQVADDAAILGAINARDANLIEASTLAKTKASNGEVKSFVAELLSSHEASLTRGGELAKRLQLSRELPPDSAMARTQSEVMDQLSLQSGATFDRTFMQYVLDAHDAELRKVTQSALPGATHPDVKAFVAERLPSLRAHQATASRWLAANPP